MERIVFSSNNSANWIVARSHETMRFGATITWAITGARLPRRVIQSAYGAMGFTLESGFEHIARQLGAEWNAKIPAYVKSEILDRYLDVEREERRAAWIASGLCGSLPAFTALHGPSYELHVLRAYVASWNETHGVMREYDDDAPIVTVRAVGPIEQPAPITLDDDLREMLGGIGGIGGDISYYLLYPATHDNRLFATTNHKFDTLALSEQSGYLRARCAGRDVWQEMKAAKAVKAVIRKERLDRMSDETFERFANDLKASQERNKGEFKVLRGEDIRAYYHERMYADDENLGTLGHSCMQHASCQGYFGVYVNNPERVGMLAWLREDGKLRGRAIVWETDEGVTVMDRAFGNDHVQKLLLAEAKSRGWNHRTYQDYHSQDQWTTPEGDMIGWDYAVTLNLDGISAWPFMDSFKYVNIGDGELATSERALSSRHYDAELTYTNGNGPQEPEFCVDCGDEIHNDDYAPYCESCHGDHCCRDCGEFREYVGGEYNYCNTCLPAHTCNDCACVEDETYRWMHGVCTDCAENHVCSEDGCSAWCDDEGDGDQLCDRCQEIAEKAVVSLRENGTLKMPHEWFDAVCEDGLDGYLAATRAAIRVQMDARDQCGIAALTDEYRALAREYMMAEASWHHTVDALDAHIMAHRYLQTQEEVEQRSVLHEVRDDARAAFESARDARDNVYAKLQPRMTFSELDDVINPSRIGARIAIRFVTGDFYDTRAAREEQHDIRETARRLALATTDETTWSTATDDYLRASALYAAYSAL